MVRSLKIKETSHYIINSISVRHLPPRSSCQYSYENVFNLPNDRLTLGLRIIFFSPFKAQALIQFRNYFSQTAGLLGRGISPSQGRYLNTGQHKHRINTYTLNIHALIGIRTQDPSVRASEDSSWLRPRGNCDRQA
jgi:hypothetical protein